MNQAQKRMAWGVVPTLGFFAWCLYSRPAAPPPPPTPLLEVLIPGVIWIALVFGYPLFSLRRSALGPWRQLGRTSRTGLVFLTINIVSPWWTPQVHTPGIYIGSALLITGMWINAKDGPTDTATLTPHRQAS
jgi:hypothetical protein